ncbi:MAG: hypothetical protein QM817_11150 [Archangium sp.]
MRFGVAVVVVLVSSGCFQRVKLTAPATADLMGAWSALEPVGVRTDTMVYLHGPARPERVASVQIDALMLLDDTAVEDPRDLLPVVLPESRTAELATKWGKRFEGWKFFQITAGSSVATGLALFIVGALVGPQIGLDRDTSGVLAVAGLPQLTVVPALCAIIGAIAFGKIDDLRTGAFWAYGDDLAARRAAAPAK